MTALSPPAEGFLLSCDAFNLNIPTPYTPNPTPITTISLWQFSCTAAYERLILVKLFSSEANQELGNA